MKVKKHDAVIVSSYVDGRLKKIAKAMKFSDSDLWEEGFKQKLKMSSPNSDVIEKLIKIKEEQIEDIQYEIAELRISLQTFPLKREKKKEKEETIRCIALDDKSSGVIDLPISIYNENSSNYRRV